MARRKAPVIPDELLDQLLAGRDPQAALGRDGLVDELKRALAERALNAEMDHHLDGEAAEGRPQQPQRLWPQDAAHRQRQAADLGAARPAGDLRSAADRQVPPPAAGLRRQDRVDVRPRHDRPRDPGPPGRALRHRRLARPDQRRHRRHPGRDRRVAEPAARGGLSAGVLRRPAGEGPRRGHRPQQGGLHRPRRPCRRPQGDPGPVDRADRGREVLAAGDERAQEPRRRGHPASPWSTA